MGLPASGWSNVTRLAMLSSNSCVSTAPLSACRLPHETHWCAQKPCDEQCRAERTGGGPLCCAKEPSGSTAEVRGLTAFGLPATAMTACCASWAKPAASCVSTAPLTACRMPHMDHWYAQKPYKEEYRAERTGAGPFCCAKEPSGSATGVRELTAFGLPAVAETACCASGQSLRPPVSAQRR